VPTTVATTITYGNSITVLMRPNTPGLGAITNGSYTVPTGTYTLYDNGTQIATGSLDASGEAYLTTSALTVGSHSLTWTYSGDANFNGSTTSTPLAITVNGKPTTTTLGISASTITYGQNSTVTATVSPTSGTGTPTGSVTFALSGSGTGSQSVTMSGGTASLTTNKIDAGSYSVTGSYSGDTQFASSISSGIGLTVNQASLTVTGSCANRVYGAPNVCSANVTGYQWNDTASNIFTATPTGATTAPPITAAGTYTATPTNTTFTTKGSTDYTLNAQNSTFTVTGGAAQAIIFPPIPNYKQRAKAYKLFAHSTSGLPVTYTVLSGPATVSGSSLTVTGTGAVSVQATCTDGSGNYAAASAVSRSFTAQ